MRDAVASVFATVLGAIIGSFLNACILGQAWLYVTLLFIAALSGAGLHKISRCR